MKNVRINLCPKMLYWKDISIQRFMDKIRLIIRCTESYTHCNSHYCKMIFTMCCMMYTLSNVVSTRWCPATFWTECIYVNFLTDNSLNIGHGGPISWPPKSPDTLGMYSKCIYYYFQYKWNIWKSSTITDSTNGSLHSCRRRNFRTFLITVTINHKYL